MTAKLPLNDADCTRLSKARHLFGIETERELSELLWRFSSILHTLEEWDQAGSAATVKSKVAEEESD